MGDESEGRSSEEGDISELLRVMNVSSLGDALQVFLNQQQTIGDQQRSIGVLSGNSFLTLDDVVDCSFEECSEEHYSKLCRDWNNNRNVLKLYNRTRMAALNDETKVSDSRTLSSLKDGANREIRPIRLCSFENSEKCSEKCSEKAHLCPKTGPLRKVDTWIYVAAAVLGMESDSIQNRKALLKALRGSVNVGNSQVLPLTGLNRSPFNLFSFLGQDIWYDRNPGVVVLPCLDPEGVRDWDGSPYSIIILCNNVPDKGTANNIAVDIGLTRTAPAHLHKATEQDVNKAITLLKRVVLASAHCLSTKNGPDTEAGQKLWQQYREQLNWGRHAAYASSRNPMNLRGVMVPVLRRSEVEGKFVAKINLSEMTPPVPGGTSAFPDPLLLAYKSSVNWTRKYGFQLMAEADPDDDDFTMFPDVSVPSFERSKSSSYSSLGSRSYS